MNRYIWSVAEKKAHLIPGLTYRMNSWTLRTIVRWVWEDIVYEKVSDGWPRHPGPDTYGRCRWTAFFNQLRFRPDDVEPICPIHAYNWAYIERAKQRNAHGQDHHRQGAAASHLPNRHRV
jgi:hypothetical protein